MEREIMSAGIAIIVIMAILLELCARRRSKVRLAVRSPDGERESVQVAHPEPPREEPTGETAARQPTAKTATEAIAGVVAWAFLVLLSGAFVVFVVLGASEHRTSLLTIIFFGMLVSLFFDLVDRRITAILLILFTLWLLSG